MLSRTKVKVNESSKYKYELMKAMWTYRTEDENFDYQIVETRKVCTLIMNSIQKLVPVVIFDKDPFDMTYEEFNDFYENVKLSYPKSPSAQKNHNHRDSVNEVEDETEIKENISKDGLTKSLNGGVTDHNSTGKNSKLLENGQKLLSEGEIKNNGNSSGYENFI